MPELRNFSPFPNFRYYSSDNRGRDFGIVIVKATYEIAPNGRLVIAEEQAPMVFSDKCHGAVNVSSLWHPSDLVPNKPRTDVIVNAVARSPGGAARERWRCGVRIERDGEPIVGKLLDVTGPRHWLPRWKRELSAEEKREWRKHRRDFERWELSRAEPIAQVPIRYEFAFGGLLARGEDSEGKPVIEDIHENPIGRGWIDAEWTDHTTSQPAPQIELESEPIADPYKIYKPQSLGPIPCAWEPRLPLGGTYDQNWIDKIWPNWPPDYQFAYHNSAHPDLVVDGYLRGDETVRLLGLNAEQALVTLGLPGDRMVVDFARADGSIERKAMNLDTLFLDVAEADVRDWRVFASWRVNFAMREFEQARILCAPGAGAAGSNSASDRDLTERTFA
ncbi:MAG: DUF2169 domain-containing protein [Roseiarcus sp.]